MQQLRSSEPIATYRANLRQVENVGESSAPASSAVTAAATVDTFTHAPGSVGAHLDTLASGTSTKRERQQACEALVKMGSVASPAVVAKLEGLDVWMTDFALKRLTGGRHHDDHVRLAEIRTNIACAKDLIAVLATVRAPEALPYLLRLSEGVRQNRWRTAERAGATLMSGGVATMLAATVPVLADLAQYSGTPVVGSMVGGACVLLGLAGYTRLLGFGYESSTPEDEGLRRAAVSALDAFGTPAATAAMLLTLPITSLYAQDALERLGSLSKGHTIESLCRSVIHSTDAAVSNDAKMFARAILDALANATAEAFLLRPSEPPTDSASVLLRAATATSTPPSGDQLLRPT